MVKSDALQVHLKSLNSAASFKPLYIFSGDEPLLMMEAMDQLRATAKKMAYTDREVLLQAVSYTHLTLPTKRIV